MSKTLYHKIIISTVGEVKVANEILEKSKSYHNKRLIMRCVSDRVRVDDEIIKDITVESTNELAFRYGKNYYSVLALDEERARQEQERIGWNYLEVTICEP